jgi:lipopolysaccharide biosynthesis glycosyltransferase
VIDVILRHETAVCLCVDARMLLPAFFVADAVRKAAPSEALSFDIVIFVPLEDADDEHRRWAAGHGISLRHDIETASVQDIAIHQERLSAATLGKLLIPDLLAGRYCKILYLDADLVIGNDVSALFRLDMGERAVAAVPAGRTWHGVKDAERDKALDHFRDLGMTPPYRYFNSGVLLVDTQSWRRQDLTRRTLDFLTRKGEICQLPDEDALNGVLDGDLIELSPIWNASPGWQQLAAQPESRPAIVHYAGPFKPWKRFMKGKGLLQDRKAYRLYRSFVRDTPWPEWLGQQWTGRDLMRAARHQAKGGIKRLLGRKRGPSKAQRQSQQAALRQFLAETRFADVEQGITVRDTIGMRLAPRGV